MYIDKIEFWVVEDEPEGDLAYNRLESIVEEQQRMGEESMGEESTTLSRV